MAKEVVEEGGMNKLNEGAHPPSPIVLHQGGQDAPKLPFAVVRKRLVEVGGCPERNMLRHASIG